MTLTRPEFGNLVGLVMSLRSSVAFALICACAGAIAEEADVSTSVKRHDTGAILVAQAAQKSGTPTSKPAATGMAEVESLLKAAKAEGQLTFYSSTAEQAAIRTSRAFLAKYGVSAQYLAITGAALMQRFSTEAAAGAIVADIQLASCCASYIEEGVKRGWIEPIRQARIPAVASEEFPARFLRGGSAVIRISPWGIGYNTDKTKGAAIPRDWPDVLAAAWKGEVLLTDPNASDTFIAFFSMIMDKYGEQYLVALRNQTRRSYGNGIQAAQGMAAGEGALLVPTLGAVVETTKSKGAPVNIVIPEYTTGAENQVIVSNLGKARHPNAARLFAHYVMTEEGNKVFNDEPGTVGVFDNKQLPKDYQAPNESAISRRPLIVKLLGF